MELGQILFHNNKVQHYECPRVVGLVLRAIEEKLQDLGLVGEYEDPFENSGNVEGFKNDVFEVHAFDWGDEPKHKFNFKYKDIEICWYKYLGRGMTINREISLEELEGMLSDCLASLAME